MTIQHAMLSSLPVIIYGPESPKELIIHGKSGYIAKNFKEIIFYARELAVNEKLRNRIGQNARTHITKNFSLAETKKQYLELYFSFEKKSTIKRKVSFFKKIDYFLNRFYYFGFIEMYDKIYYKLKKTIKQFFKHINTIIG